LDPKTLQTNLLELIRRSSTDMPPDIEEAIRAGFRREEKGTPAKSVMKSMLDSIDISRCESKALCQDTGSLVWNINYPDGSEILPVTKAIENAIVEATERSWLRPNAVDIVSGKNSGNNLGAGSPLLHFHPWKKKTWEFSMMNKGGGCENCGIQYKLPDSKLGAGRDLDGVYKCVLDGIFQAQGKGCAPGIACVGIGGNRDSGMECAKNQIYRKLDDINPDPALAKLEKKLFQDCNKLGIGPMGYGGKTTVLGVKVGTLYRLPACYFVSIAYMCWSDRRAKMTISGNKVTFSN
jgi:fumarate hydratase, class I